MLLLFPVKICQLFIIILCLYWLIRPRLHCTENTFANELPSCTTNIKPNFTSSFLYQEKAVKTTINSCFSQYLSDVFFCPSRIPIRFCCLRSSAIFAAISLLVLFIEIGHIYLLKSTARAYRGLHAVLYSSIAISLYLLRDKWQTDKAIYPSDWIAVEIISWLLVVEQLAEMIIKVPFHLVYKPAKKIGNIVGEYQIAND